MEKRHRIAEIVWLVIAIACIVPAVHKTVTHGFEQSFMFYILVAVSFMMYTWRKNMRKSSED